MIGLALAHMRHRALATGLTVLLLSLAVAMLTILLLFSAQLTERFARDARGIDLVVGAKGSPLQLILSSIYHADIPTGNIPFDSIDLLRQDPAVANVIPLALGDGFRSFRIVGTEPAYVDLYGATLAGGRMFAGHGEAVIGASVAQRTGAALGQQFVGSHGLGAGSSDHDEEPFTTVGILAPTGSVIDRLILVSVDSVWRVHGLGPEHAHDHAASAGEPLPDVTALLVQYRSAAGAVRVPMFVNQQPRLQAAVPAVETARLLSLLGWGIDAAAVFAWLLVLVGGLSIFVAMLSSAAARQADIALLRVMGMAREQVFGTVVIEGVLTAFAGAVGGLVLGHAAIAVAGRMFRRLAEMGLDPLKFTMDELAVGGVVVALGGIAALFPALRAFRSDLARTLAQAR